MNIDKIYNNLISNYDLDDVFLDDILTTIEFRLSKNKYHYNNIVNLLQKSTIDNSSIENSYYECENLIINIRSTVDNVLQLINFVHNMGFKSLDINLKNILKHPKCGPALKDIFLLYTHPKNDYWNFIYISRNDIIHEVCIKSQFPIVVDEIYNINKLSSKVYFINQKGNKVDLLFFYKEIISHMEDFCDKILFVLSEGYI